MNFSKVGDRNSFISCIHTIAEKEQTTNSGNGTYNSSYRALVSSKICYAKRNFYHSFIMTYILIDSKNVGTVINYSSVAKHRAYSH